MAVGRLTQLVFECDDAVALARFWQQVLDLPEPPGGPGLVKGAGGENGASADGDGRDREAGGRASAVGDACEWSVASEEPEPVSGQERPEWVTLEWEPVGRFSFHRCEGYVPPRWPGGCGEHQAHFDPRT